MTDDIQRLVERMAPTTIYVQWSDDGQHIRKWSHEPFDGSAAFVDADELNALRAEVKRLREALEPFVRHGRALGVFDGDPGPHWIMTDKGHRDVPALDFMRARAALTQTKDTTDDA